MDSVAPMVSSVVLNTLTMKSFAAFLAESYVPELTYLYRYLQNTTMDYHSIWWTILDVLRAEGREEAERVFGVEADSDDWNEVDPDQFEDLPKSLQTYTYRKAIDYLMMENPTEVPTPDWFLRPLKLLPPTTWLVHFSDDAENITTQGFTHGVDDMQRLGLTTHFTKQSKSQGGYNFAFRADSREAKHAAAQHTYGRHAVVFQSAAVYAFHVGDEEHQAIFWGPAVKQDQIAYIQAGDHEWAVMAGSRRSKTTGQGTWFFKGSFVACVAWVEKNIQQYRKRLFH